MAQGKNKKYDKITHAVSKKSSSEKKKAIRKMVEALISENSTEAANHLHEYLQTKMRDLILGEAEEKDEKDEKEESDEDEDDDEKEESDEDEDDDEDDDEDEVKESKSEWNKIIKENADILDLIDESLLDDIYSIVLEKVPSYGMTKKQKSSLVKKARKGENIGNPGKKFKEIQRKAAKRYGSKEAGERVAAASMWKAAAKK